VNKLSYNEESTTEQIVSILKETNATIKDFSQTLDLSENIVRTTINRLKKHGVVKHTGMFINRYKLWRLVKPEELDVNANFEEYREILYCCVGFF
jgi:predicted ArsR family transcriptional regulator